MTLSVSSLFGGFGGAAAEARNSAPIESKSSIDFQYKSI